MKTHIINFLEYGLFHLSTLGYIVFILIVTNITVLSITIFLHRYEAHRSLELHPALYHFFRFWLWLTTGTITKEWVALHRKHHAFIDAVGDPHSPHIFGLRKLFFESRELYRQELKEPNILEKYGYGTPDDWLEHHVYSAHDMLGVVVMLLINLILFGPIGLSICAVQILWVLFLIGGFINGIAHKYGYRNFDSHDKSHNIFPWGIIFAGEELHNNHHAFGSSARFSYKWYEFDYGWMWIKIFSFLGLAKVKKTMPAHIFTHHHAL